MKILREDKIITLILNHTFWNMVLILMKLNNILKMVFYHLDLRKENKKKKRKIK